MVLPNNYPDTGATDRAFLNSMPQIFTRQQLLRLVLGGHEHQAAMPIDRGLQLRPWGKAEGVAQLPRNRQLAFGGEGDGGHFGSVRRMALPACR